MIDFLQTPDGKQAKWYSKRMVHVAAVISGVSLLVIIAVVTGFVVMAKEHEKSTRRIIEVKLNGRHTVISCVPVQPRQEMYQL